MMPGSRHYRVRDHLGFAESFGRLDETGFPLLLFRAVTVDSSEQAARRYVLLARPDTCPVGCVSVLETLTQEATSHGRGASLAGKCNLAYICQYSVRNVIRSQSLLY
jgi:hypothetical protein